MKKFIFLLLSLSFFNANATLEVKRYDKMPILETPPSCTANFWLNPALGRSKGKRNRVVQYDRQYRETQRLGKEILKSKGYISNKDYGCDYSNPLCFGSTNYYLTIYAVVNHERKLFRGVVPKDLSLHINHKIRNKTDATKMESGYYYDAGKIDLSEMSTRDDNSEFHKFYIEELRKLPTCEELKLLYIK
jgi:hypothetical protein